MDTLQLFKRDGTCLGTFRCIRPSRGGSRVIWQNVCYVSDSDGSSRYTRYAAYRGKRFQDNTVERISD